jgi:hypothetical protein
MFDHIALNTAAGRVHSMLGLTDAKHQDQAITRINQALAEDSDGRGRQRAFNQVWLATCVLADGDPTSGACLGYAAVDAVRGLISPRLLEQLGPLQAQTYRYPHHGEVRQLAYDLQLLRICG